MADVEPSAAKRGSRPLRVLGGTFGLLVLVVLLLGWLELRRISAERERVSAHLNHHADQVKVTQEVMRLAQANGSLTLSYFLADDPVEREQLLRRREQARDAITRLLAGLEQTSDDDLERAMLAEVVAARAPFVQAFQVATTVPVARLPSEERRDRAVAEVQRSLVNYAQKLDSFLTLQMTELDETVTESGKAIEDARRWNLAFTALGIILALGAAMAIAWRLARDISRREAAERARIFEASLAEAKAAADAKSQFLACMSHEIRTPLNAVLGMVECLTDTRLDPEQRGYADNIRVGGEMLLEVIGDILDFSKLDAGNHQIEHADFDLETLMEACSQLLAPRAREKGLELIVSIEPGTPTALRGDAARLQRLIANFLVNAIKFTLVGRVTLRARLVTQDAGRATVRIEVQDTGIGIPLEVQPRLFQAFVQADASTTRRFGGTGLGLAICRKIADLMQGSVGVVSEPGQGATFWAAIPLEVVPLPQREPDRQSGWRPRTLHVDAAGTGRQDILRQLRALGLPCDSVAGSDRVLAILRREAASGTPYQLVVLDAIRPELHQLALVSALRRDESLEGIRAMLLTSFDAPRSTPKDAPFDAALVKPFRRAALAETVERLSSVAQPLAPGGPAQGPASPAAARVLVVEDVAVNRTLALALLKKLGYQAEAVENGVVALEAVLNRHFDLVFMDCQMPEMDGFEATRRIRGLPAPLRDLPIVAMTANAVAGDREKCLAAGMNDYLSKPVTSAGMKVALERWIAPSAKAWKKADEGRSIGDVDRTG